MNDQELAREKRLPALAVAHESDGDAFDREWRFLDLNSRVEELFGKDREELIGKVIWEVYPQTVNTTLHLRCRQAMEEKVPAHFEVESKIMPGVWF